MKHTRLLIVLLATAAVLLAACGDSDGGSGDGDSGGPTSTAPPDTAPPDTAPPETEPPTTSAPVDEGEALAPYDWSTRPAVDLGGGWTAQGCEGDAPLVCVSLDGEPVGVVEYARFAVERFDFLQGVEDPRDAAALVAENFLETFAADREECVDGSEFEPVEPRDAVIGGEDGIRYGFRVRRDGATVELVVDHTVVSGETVHSFVANALDEGACLAPEGEFSVMALTDFDEGLSRLVAASVLANGASEPADPPEAEEPESPEAGAPVADGSGCVVGGDVVPDGRWYGMVASATAEAISFDVACWFTGEDAVAAAAEDGAPEVFDFYIRNESDRLRTVPVADDATVRALVQPGGAELGDVTYAEWLTLLEQREPVGGVWLDVQDGAVRLVEEQYTP